MSLVQISALTKIPVRMLDLIEAGNFAALPARTYATGFTRAYARAVGLDENEYVAAVRQELGLVDTPEIRHAPSFEPGDPARVPTARFAWLAAIAALLVVAAGLSFWRTYYAPAVNLPPIVPPAAAPLAPAAAGQPPVPRAAPAAAPAGVRVPAVTAPGAEAPAGASAPAEGGGVPVSPPAAASVPGPSGEAMAAPAGPG